MTDATKEHTELLAAIGRALGSDAPYPEVEGARGEGLHLGTMQWLPAGTSREVLGGAVDAATGRVAWVEQLSGEPQGGYVPVSIDLHFAWDGQHRGKVEVPTYNPYFGCRVGFMRWYGDALVVIYREKHKTLAMRLEPPSSEALTLAVLGDTWTLDDDTVYFVSTHPGLLEGRLLPSLELALPLPVATPSRGKQFWRHSPGTLALAPRPPIEMEETRDAYFARLEAERGSARLVPLPPREARAFVPSPQSLWTRLEALLARTAPPPLGVDLLVGAVAMPFWRDELPIATRYASAPGRGSSPRYLPVYWYQRLLEEDRTAAEAWLHWLERLAALDDVDPTPWTRGEAAEEVAARTALVYLRAQAEALALACRAGRLPEGEYCYLFMSPDRTRRLEEDTQRPPGFHEVLRRLVARPPKSLSTYDDD